MWAWFLALPAPAKITLVAVGALALALALVLLGVFGRATITFNKGVPKIVLEKNRSCADCILLIFGKRERLEYRKRMIENTILKDQMNFAEQKILEMSSILTTSYREDLSKARTGNPNLAEENKQYRMYEAILKNAMMLVKDEIRRSFKENGFEYLSGSEFSAYIKNKVNTLVAIGRDHVVNVYPYEGMIVPIEKRLEELQNRLPKIDDLCFELFIKSKEVRLDAKKKLDILEKEFADEIDEFVEAKK